MVGYQGESARPYCHRQSVGKGRPTQTGTPKAPARCAVDRVGSDHQVELRHQCGRIHERAVRFVELIAEVDQRKTIGHVRNLFAPKPFCKLKSRTPGMANGSKAASGMDRNGS